MKKILTVMIIGLAAPAFAAETLNGGRIRLKKRAVFASIINPSAAAAVLSRLLPVPLTSAPAMILFRKPIWIKRV